VASPTVIVDGLTTLQRRLVSEFEARSRAAVSDHGRFVVALPGGSVAANFFPSLATAAVDWSRTHFFWIDERAVPPEHPDSNYRLASDLWLTPARIPSSQIHRLPGEEVDLEYAAQTAGDELIAIAGNPPQLDLALVGVGEDGHVASIFDVRKPGLDWRTRQPVIAIYDAQKPPPRRLTFTMPVLSSAVQIILVALGRSKAPVMADALSTDGSETPVAELLYLSRSVLVLLDHEAAQLIS
jgi:6-phosphogluconolactonase